MVTPKVNYGLRTRKKALLTSPTIMTSKKKGSSSRVLETKKNGEPDLVTDRIRLSSSKVLENEKSRDSDSANSKKRISSTKVLESKKNSELESSNGRKRIPSSKVLESKKSSETELSNVRKRKPTFKVLENMKNSEQALSNSRKRKPSLKVLENLNNSEQELSNGRKRKPSLKVLENLNNSKLEPVNTKKRNASLRVSENKKNSKPMENSEPTKGKKKISSSRVSEDKRSSVVEPTSSRKRNSSPKVLDKKKNSDSELVNTKKKNTRVQQSSKILENSKKDESEPVNIKKRYVSSRVTKNKKTVASEPDKTRKRNSSSILLQNKMEAKSQSESPKKGNSSFRLFENKTDCQPDHVNKEDVYEFTFDPSEEPPPQKKKRKRAVKKKPAKPKTVIFKNTYEEKMSKALSVLKKNVAKKPCTEENPTTVKTNNTVNPQQTVVTSTPNVLNTDKRQNIMTHTVSNLGTSNQITTNMDSNNHQNFQTTSNTVSPKNPIQNSVTDNPSAPAYNSVRIEDIVLDFEQSDNHHDIDYSPVNSPYRPKTPVEPPRIVVREPSEDRIISNDPLNLTGNLSFFDDKPIANSSMNVSARHPLASPWRVEFQNLPIKWHVNSYVKPNMTPAVECSFVNFNDSNKKKHVYTNLVPQTNEELPDIVDKDAPNLIQTSIISFIKEVAERSAAKKQRRSRSRTPAGLFNDLANDTNKNPVLNPRQVATPRKNKDDNNAAPKTIIDKSDEINIQEKENSREHLNRKCSNKENLAKTPSKNKNNNVTPKTPLQESNENNIVQGNEISREHLKRKCNNNENQTPAKTPRKNMDNTYFGFDETDQIDQENVPPKKVNDERVRALRPRARAVLKEINAQSGPVRANIPLAAKSAAVNSDTASKLYEQMKTATDAPVFPDENAVDNIQTEVINEENDVLNEEDSQSVHLFEDIEFIHHFKQPQRKSYGKAKKVAFQQAVSDSDTQDSDLPVERQDESGEEDDLRDLSFEIPTIAEKAKTRKATKKQKRTKKEEAEAAAWAANFNAMCEEVEEFPLVLD